MHYSASHRIPHYLLAVLAVASPLLAYGAEVKLAPVVDLNLRHTDAASSSLREPKALVLEAKTVPLLTDEIPSAKSQAEQKQTKLSPVVRSAAPFNPTEVESKRQNPAPVKSMTDAVKVAPVIRVYEPIRPAPRTAKGSPQVVATPSPVVEPVYRSVYLATRTDRLVRTIAPSTQRVESRDALSAQIIATLDSFSRPKPAPSIVNSSMPQSVVSPKQVIDVATVLSKRSSPVVELAKTPIILQPSPAEVLAQGTPPTITATPIVQLAEAVPLLAVLQQSPSASDLPAPATVEQPALTEQQLGQLEGVEAFDLDLKPIKSLSARTKPEAGEMPTNYAAARFAREGAVAHRMGFSRSQTETEMMWEAPAVCHRPLYFEDINLERYGYKVPLIQPALSAAHFFGRVPLLPYMMVSEGHRKCQYTLGHYRPGDYAPYSLYVPRLRLDASAAELAAAASVILIFP